jgi:hypothetical protein
VAQTTFVESLVNTPGADNHPVVLRSKLTGIKLGFETNRKCCVQILCAVRF